MTGTELGELFRLSLPWWEILLRGTAVYWFIFLLLRFVLRRDVGSVGVADVLLLVLIADAAQNAMSGGYQSITDGMLLIATIVGWNVGIDWACYKSAKLARLLEPRPLPLVRDGQIQYRNLRRELMTNEELMSKLRLQGIEKLREVKRAYIESDGSISVIRFDNARSGGAPSGGGEPLP